MPSKSKTEYVANRTSGIVHKRIGGLSPESCNLDQIKIMQVALNLDKLYYKRLCKRCFSEESRAVVARAEAR